ncbi:MAG: class I fructose-bisphosphate aldolase [Egibacteraceae bacterium]
MGNPVLTTTAAAMVAPGKGVLAADESIGTMSKRLEAVGVPPTAENRRAYRDMLVTTPGISEFVSGVIMSDDIFRGRANDGTPFPEAVASLGMLPGIKVDTGAKPLAGAPGETVTEGLDGLRERLAEYVALGARFAKWRAVINIDDVLPSCYGIDANAHALARYAALCQEAGVVPIVEPEVLMDGDHSISRCEEVTEAVLQQTFSQLVAHRVQLEGVVLKPNMVLPGKGCSQQANVEEVAEATLRCLARSVPAAVPGIAFLSGGQGPEPATARLNEMNRRGPQPWGLSFSFGRALMDPALQAWKGDTANVEAAQAALAHRCACNGAARSGAYTPEMERA